MNFESSLRPGEKVVWSAQLEKAAHDATIRPAPPVTESKPRMCGTQDGADVGAFKVSDERIARALREKWGVKL
jgi:hypothetical protein